ncbi:S60 ribosomal protein L13a [Cavenderia fasciculata]|uniref:S60 ribosomal protein L13a n=1 Tax=Cavenderia fasciculata TaxID=261658 RepID=F4Q9I5_CACFS|nr:S60 ribosomal protein L13a [Cavenderia fasciculata]EGG15354.1 S60 ribosomal protein L13a [Cavenderia fasciculata]|eukprot:XP_004354096.1 S60 ribosomal protein L13a [Cavenderia fasciculata]
MIDDNQARASSKRNTHQPTWGGLTTIVVDANGHLLGRLAAKVAKELLSGQKVTVVRCEGILISGPMRRNLLKWDAFMNLTMNTNHARGPRHYRTPSMMFWRTVRGMLPHKTFRGALALRRFKVFEGIPAPYNTQKKMCVPSALKSLTLNPIRKVTVLGELASKAGWKHKDVVQRLEAQRKENDVAYHRKQALLRYYKRQAAKKVGTA